MPVLKAIIAVCRQFKTPQILLDLYFVGSSKGINWSTEETKEFIDCLQNFSVYNEEILSIATHYIENSGLPLTVDLLEPYFNKLVANKQYEQLLYLFDRTRNLSVQKAVCCQP